MSTNLLRATATAVVAVVALAAATLAAAAGGPATIQPISWQDPLSATGSGLIPCYPDLAGTLAGTDTGTGHVVTTANGIHVQGVETQSYRIDFANGWYLLSSSPTHFSANLNFGSGQITNTSTQQDRGMLYSANAALIGMVAVWGVTHITWRDTNRNQEPDPGEITANVNLTKVSCPT